MKIVLETGGGQNLIRAYRPGAVTINQLTYTRSIVVTPEQIEVWAPSGFADLARAHFEVLERLRPEVVLLGTGARLRMPAGEATRPLTDARIGLEVMDTGAACRTYNILMSEGRRVVAALLMIEEMPRR